MYSFQCNSFPSMSYVVSLVLALRGSNAAQPLSGSITGGFQDLSLGPLGLKSEISFVRKKIYIIIKIFKPSVIKCCLLCVLCQRSFIGSFFHSDIFELVANDERCLKTKEK